MRAARRHATVLPFQPSRMVLPMLGFAVVGYFLYHAVISDRGLVAFFRFQQEILAAQEELAHVRLEKAVLEKRVNALSNKQVDADLLDEYARHSLGYAEPKEVMILRD